MVWGSAKRKCFDGKASDVWATVEKGNELSDELKKEGDLVVG